MLPLLILVLLLGLACQFSMGGSQPPADRTPASPPPTAQDWRSALANAKPGDQVTVTLTEGEVTSLVASQLQNSPDVTIQNPKVILRNDQMEVYGQAITNAVTANFRAALNVTIDDQGKPHLEITSADFGSIPVPSSLRERMTESLDRALMNAVGPASDRFKVSNVDIADGYMTITGTVQ